MRTRSLTSMLAVGGAILVGLAASASLAMGAGGAGSATLPALPTKAMSASDRARVTASVNALLAEGTYTSEVPGLLIGIWSPTDGVYRGSFGQAVLTSKAAPRLGSSFRIGSVSKTFTATVILQLVEEGRLALDGRVRTYLPALAKRYPAIGTRTVRQLLGMRSGLPEYTDGIQKVGVRTPKRVWTADQLIAFAMRGPVKPAGAARSVYTNTNYVILGELAAAVTGTPIATLIRERLLRPLGLRHTVYPAPSQNALPTPFTHGYVGPSGAAELKGLGAPVKAGTDVTAWSPSWGNAAGMMSSTLDDLARWGNGLLGNTLLSKPLQRARLTMAPQSANWTYGLGMLQLTGGQWTGHSGGIPGWSTWVLKNVKTGTVVVTSVNACCGGAATTFTFQLLQALYPDSFLTGPPLKAGAPLAINPKVSIMPAAGWRIWPDATVPGRFVSVVKRGVVLSGLPLTVPAGQTVDDFVKALRDGEAEPGTSITAATGFTIAGGLQGFTWSSRRARGDARSWVVTDGSSALKLSAIGPAAALAALRAELDRMAASATIAS